ncbi:MAG TPA: NarK/NasA family nitrate transporter [Chromatiales bacterium]|nr:NarK/NasA family nitrate transporter [Chromatiales bacterium]
MISNNRQAISVLAMSTMAFSACFAVWVIFSIIGIPIKSLLDLSETQFGLLVAMPILSGSLFRLPVGILTDRFGGRNVFVVLLISIIAPLYLIGSASQYWQFLVLGLFVGVAGASFSVGVTYTTKWFPPARRGMAMGIFGAGNAGAAITYFVAPTLLVVWGWQSVPKVYAIVMVLVAIVFWMFTYEDPEHRSDSDVSLKEQLRLLCDPKIWKYCQYYSLVFGGFVGLSLWVTKYYVSEYQLDLTTAALLAAVFVLPSGVVRAFGGWLSDKYGAYVVTWGVMWVSWVCLFLLSYPQSVMTIKAISGEDWNFSVGLNIWVFTALLFILGIAWGLGKASVFKGLADEYPDNLGAASGIVGLAGGLGGFLLPVLFGMLIDLTRVNASAFMLLYGATCVSLVLVYFTFGREHQTEAIQHAKEEVEDDAILHSMADIVAGQREGLKQTIAPKLKSFAQQLAPVMNEQTTLEAKLVGLKSTLDNYKYIYALDADGVQITSTLLREGSVKDDLGRDRSQRPYMEGMFDGRDFKLSESYISRNQRRPSLTAVHAIRGDVDELVGFAGVDYDLRSLPRKGALFKGSGAWRQLKGDPSIRGGLFQQERTQSIMDSSIDDVLRLIELLMVEHGIFHAELHFSSSRANLWHIDAPYSYHILGVEELTDTDICLAYPQQVYDKRATMPADDIHKIFEKFKELRFADETIYLRAGSLNICSGMVGLNFSCDGSHFMHFEEFMEKGHEFWFGV